MEQPLSWEEEQLQRIGNLRGFHQAHELEGIDPSTLDLIPQPLRSDSAAGFSNSPSLEKHVGYTEHHDQSSLIYYDGHRKTDSHDGNIDHVFYGTSDLDKIKALSQTRDADDLMTFSPSSSRRSSWNQGDDGKFLAGNPSTKGHQS